MGRMLSSTAVAAALVLSAAAAVAQEPSAQLSVDDVVRSFADQPAAAPAPGAPQGECEKLGMVANEDGECEAVKGTRGWSLPGASRPAATPTRPSGSSSVAVNTPRPSRPTAVATAPRPATQARKDLLITFRTGSAELTEQGRANARIFAQAANMPQLSAVRFEISGHTDAAGGRDKNLTLSQQRAEAVKTYLTSLGVDAGRLEAKGYGFDRPVVAGNPMAAGNRRVEAKRID